MAKQNINVGTAANDKKGDSLRAAFVKVNANFTELYTELGLVNDVTLSLGAFEFAGSTLSTTDSSAIVIDQATTITSNLSVGGDILPQTANGGDLGSSTLPWRSLYVSNNTIYIGGTAVGLDANGNLTTGGTVVGSTPAWANITGKPTFATVATSGAYADLTGKPTIPTLVSQLANDSGFLTSVGNISNIQSESDVSIEINLSDSTLRRWQFGEDGSLTLPSVGKINNGEYDWTFGSTGNTTFPTGLTLAAARGPNTVNFTSGIDKEFQIETQTNTTGRLWNFSTDGSLTIPGDIKSNSNINIDINLSDSTLRRWQFGEDGGLTFPDGYLKIVPNGANPYISNIIDNGFGLVSGSAIQIRQSVADAYGISINSSTTDTSLGDIVLASGSNIDVNGSKIILGQYVVNSLDGDNSLTGQNKIEINDDSILIGLNVSTLSSGTTTSAFNGWTFYGQAGTLTFPDATVQTTAYNPSNIRSEGNINIEVNLSDSTLRRWQFGEDGLLTFPDGTSQSTAGGTWPVTNTAGASGPTKVAIGRYAGEVSQGANAVAIGNVAGYTGQVAGAVAIGWQAGETTQGNSAVAIGNSAGNSSQGASAVAVGLNAGLINQGNAAVAVGPAAGNTSQGLYAVAIGEQSGLNLQGESAVAVGSQAGYTGQGTYSVAVGYAAGQTSQAANTIILNATGSTLNQTTANTFTVKPVRQGETANAMYYNSSTGEITYAGVFSFSVAADDSTQRAISNNELIKFIGAGTVTTASDAEGNITITGTSIPAVVTTGAVGVSGQAHVKVQFTVASATTVTAVGVTVIGISTPASGRITLSGSPATGSFDIVAATNVQGQTFILMPFATNASGTGYGAPIAGTGTDPCYVKGTLITMADMSRVAVENITYSDNILVWDFDLGEFASAKPLWIKKTQTTVVSCLLTFSDHSILQIVGDSPKAHRIFNKEAGKFTYGSMPETPIGTTTFNDQGEEITLISKEWIVGEVEFYNVMTDYHMNLFANSILTSMRYNNLYPITDMKFVKDSRTLRTADDYPNVEERLYKGFRLAEQTQSVEEIETHIQWLLTLEVERETECV